MVKLFNIYFVSSLLLLGCASTSPIIPSKVITEPKKVEIAVATPCPVPPVIDRPQLSLSTLNNTSTPEDIIKSYAASIKALQGYALQLESILNTYRSTDKSNINKQYILDN